jgi:cytochrome c-type biogenesis protein CcmH
MDSRVRALAGSVITVVLALVVIVGLLMGDNAAEDRVNALGARIKCPVCQGEAIGDSPSETALAMMDIVEEKVAAGESDAQVVDFFTARYGTGILLDPPFAGSTLLVWLLPAVAVAGGVWMILSRKRQPTDAENPHV